MNHGEAIVIDDVEAPEPCPDTAGPGAAATPPPAEVQDTTGDEAFARMLADEEQARHEEWQATVAAREAQRSNQEAALEELRQRVTEAIRQIPQRNDADEDDDADGGAPAGARLGPGFELLSAMAPGSAAAADPHQRAEALFQVFVNLGLLPVGASGSGDGRADRAAAAAAAARGGFGGGLAAFGLAPPGVSMGALREARAAGVPLDMLLSERDFTPEDYEALCRLDDTVPSKAGLAEEALATQRQSMCCATEEDCVDESGAATRCAICLEGVAVGQDLLVLGCGHRFHGECGVEWLRRKAACPVCQAGVEYRPQQP